MDGYTFSPDLSDEHRNGCNNTVCTENYSYDIDGQEYVCVNNGRTICPIKFSPGAVILHEFGHALGMYHEHQNYLGGNVIEYDIDGATLFSLHQRKNRKEADEKCIQDLCTKLCFDESIRPSFCDSGCNPDLIPSSVCQSQWDDAKEDAQNNVLKKYECTFSNCPYGGSDFDPDSVMMYSVADYMIKPNKDGERINPTYKNYTYSEKDLQWLGAFYPVDSITKPNIHIKFNDGETWKKYWVKKVITEKLQPCVGINFIFDLPVLEPTEPPSTCEVSSVGLVKGLDRGLHIKIGDWVKEYWWIILVVVLVVLVVLIAMT
jgi:hypothetical protein